MVKLKPALLLLVREGEEFSVDWEEKMLSVSEFNLAEEGAVEVLIWVEQTTKVWKAGKVPTMNSYWKASLDKKLKYYEEDELNCVSV